MKRNVIVLLLALFATAAGAWAPQVKGGGDVEDVKTIDVIASRFQFEPGTITVGQGDSVRLRLHSADRSHAVAITAFRVKTLIPKGGETVTVEFVANRGYVRLHVFGILRHHSRMKGKLVVLAKRK